MELDDDDDGEEFLRASVMFMHLLQNPRDWYFGKVQFPVGHSIVTDLLFGPSVWKIPE